MVQEKYQGRSGVMIARGVMEPVAHCFPLRLINMRAVDVTVPKGAVVAELEGIAWMLEDRKC